jgi:hypothetical protein
MKKNYYYYFLCICIISMGMVSCQEEEDASVPMASTLTVNVNTGIKSETEFTFTITQVASDAISFFPYGVEDLSLRGNLIDEKAFVDGKTTFKVKYSSVGSFNAVVVTNNHSKDGKSVQNTISAAQIITITE